ncbi:Exopolyphosphatase [Acaryochloris thomasi RCC1774]|uniref:Exopolyphosphatase n=1 Tax=Acaryochloris thomasi RCC1774 TaxID=1764569 RepID=A0A2W1JW90_9CYAN|nr:Exopolyphosphatase [Acaryochloris thomasi RCC1774]
MVTQINSQDPSSLQQWPSALQPREVKTLAAIDIGTNSIHMVVVKINPDLPAFDIVDAEKSTVRLGERCPDTGNLTPEATVRAISALRRCQEIARGLDVNHVIAVATSAVREAPNGSTFIQAVEKELGLKINLISGPEEARRIYLGVLSGVEFDHKPHVIVDIGGGSTEIILGDGREPRYLSSTKVGAVRLTEDFLTTDPISKHEFECLQAYVRGKLEWPVEELRSHLSPNEQPQLIGTSGTIESLIKIHACETLGACPTSLHGHILSLEDLQKLTHRLRKLSYDERCKIAGMSERRAEIIVAGAVVLQEAMSLLGIDSITACGRALREGVIVDWMLTHGLIEDRLRYQGSIRQRSALNLAQKYGVDLEAAQRIAQFAVSLFEQTQGILHQWTDVERELLWAAAILHNAGHFVSHSAHHKHSYYLIRHGGLLGYTDPEVEIVANLARYHRKGPPKKRHQNYQNLANETQRQIVNQLSAILKLAVGLDRRQSGAVATFRCDYDPEQKTLNLHVQPSRPDEDCALELWSLTYKKQCFETEFDVQLDAQLDP